MPIGLFAIVAIGLLADRMIWVDQVVAGVNLTNVLIADVNCPSESWVEVAPSEDAEQPMRYRCGFMFWPFYPIGRVDVGRRFVEGSRNTEVSGRASAPVWRISLLRS